MLRIAIDPGHGGHQPGCVYPPITEKDYTLDFCKRLKKALDDLGHQAILTRSVDESLLFSKRAYRAQAAKADLVLCVHVNAHVDPNVRGLITYYMPADNKGRSLAGGIMRTAPAPLKRISRIPVAASLDGRGDDAVLQRFNLPAVLVEVGFASNARDNTYLTSEDGKASIIKCLCDAVDTYEKDLAKL